MIVGVLVGKKMYSLLKYLFTMLIALFMYKDKAGKASGGSDSLVGVGEVLLLVYLTCDSLTGAVQEWMKLEHQTKSGLMMAMPSGRWTTCLWPWPSLGRGWSSLGSFRDIQMTPMVNVDPESGNTMKFPNW